MAEFIEKFRVIATKVLPYVKERIGRICHKRGMSEYDMLQMMCDCIVRYMDDRHNLTEEMEQVMSIFEHMEGWANALNLADPTGKKEVAEALYVLQDPTGKRKGFRVVMVRKPFFGEWDQCENVQMILERMLEIIFPERYKRLRALAIEMDCNSILQLLDTLIDAHTIEQLNAEMRKDFEDCNRHEFGKPIEYGARTKRVHKKSTEIFDRQGKIHFDPADVPDLPELQNDK